MRFRKESILVAGADSGTYLWRVSTEKQRVKASRFVCLAL